MPNLIQDTLQEWSDDNATQLAAAIAYYTIFSIIPFLVISLSIAGYFLNADAARNQLFYQLGSFIGAPSADFLKSLVENSAQASTGFIPSLISIIVLLIGASGIFLQIQNALNTIWGVPKQKISGVTRRGLMILKKRLVSFLMVMATGFLLLLFLVISAVISALLGNSGGGAQNMLLPEIVNFLVLFIMITVLCAMVYRVIPDKEITWTDVWLGAAVTAILFLLGRYGIGFYLGFSKSSSIFGAAGSLIVLLIWIYYSAQIFLLGAEFTQVYSKKIGSHKRPEADASAKAEHAPVLQKHPYEE